MRKAARAIVTHEDKMLAMKRNKFGHEYYVLVGGEVELGETPEQTLVREVQEETGLTVTNYRLVYIEEAGSLYGTQYIYLCDVAEYNEPRLDQNALELKIEALGQNLFQPLWIKQADLPKLPFRSETLKQKIIQALTGTFPDQPETFSPTEDIRYTSEVTK